jgi:hypothetical protein
VALPPVTFPTLGWVVIDWLETYLCNGPGDVQGEDLVIDDEEALLICWAYRLWPKDHADAGRRLVHRAIYSRPKGRRKSMLAGALDCAEGFGPVRFDGWDANGNPVGRPVTNPLVRILATEEGQTGNTYDNVVYMLTEGEAANEYEFDLGRSKETSSLLIIKEPGGGKIAPVTSGAASKDGGLESKATADETHLYTDRKLRGLYRTVARNTGKRKIAEPWMLDTTTMFVQGEKSIAEQAFDKYAKMPVEEAVTKHGVLLDHHQGDEPKRFHDDRSLIKAMRPGYGPAAPWIDFKRIVKIIRDAEDPETEAYQFYLNRPRHSATHWLSPDEIAGMLADLGVELGSRICGGFDGSENDDHTGLMGCTEAGDIFTVGVWTPSGESIAWREDVNAAVDWLHKNFIVKRFYADPAWWIDEIGKWSAKHGTVTEFWTGGRSVTKMAVATGACRTALRHGARIDPAPMYTDALRVVNDRVAPNAGPEDGVPLVQWHLTNARTKKVRIRDEETDRAEDAYLVRKDRAGSPLKIDTVTASILARRARDDAMKAGEFEEDEEATGYASWR